MKNEILHSEIRNLSETIKEQQEMVLSHQGKIPKIELDILMGNIRKLYESLVELNKINDLPANQVVPEPAPRQNTLHTDELIANITASAPMMPPVAEEIAEPPVAVVATITEITPLPVATVPVQEPMQPEEIIAGVETPVEASPEEISNEAVMPQALLAKERSKEYSKPAQKVAHTASLFDDHLTVAETFQSTPTLYDKIAATKQDNSLAEKHLKNPVSDLKKSIGINEKFAFINELFDGDLNAYNESIDRLNNSNSHVAAINFLENELAAKYNWNGESDAFLKLSDLVERRFSA